MPKLVSQITYTPIEKDEHGLFTCNHCDKKFPNVPSLHTHKTRVHEEDYLCNFCNVPFKTLQNLRKHNQQCQKGNIFCYKSCLLEGCSELEYFLPDTTGVENKCKPPTIINISSSLWKHNSSKEYQVLIYQFEYIFLKVQSGNCTHFVDSTQGEIITREFAYNWTILN